MDSEEDENDLLFKSKSPLLVPTINDINIVNNSDFKEQFLRLTSMVRRVYFSYLHKSLLSNYATSCPTKSLEDFDSRIKNCASQMELFAVRNALETSLYRKAMTKLISEVKDHTSEQKLHKTLTSFLISPPEKCDMAVQTDDVETVKTENLDTLERRNSMKLQNNLFEDGLDRTLTVKIEPLPAADDSNSIETMPFPLNNSRTSPEDFKGETRLLLNHSTETSSIDLNVSTQETTSNNSIFNLSSDSHFQSSSLNESQLLENNDDLTKSKAEDSQDSLLQTMEDMFCESEDSSDLMTLIEKHSHSQTVSSTPKSTSNPLEVETCSENKKEPRVESKRKRKSKSSSEKSKKRALTSSPDGFNELKSSKYRKKVNEIWLVERVHQTSKLKSKMLEISLLDYRKYGKIKARFAELFGESEDEDAMIESPVCIEDHLQACKERIAPWIVKHLTPFYNQKRISSRELFKTICRHVTDMLIIKDTFPEETTVEIYMRDFFKNKQSIKTEADIYL